jgi:hypothetical protein
MDDNELKAAILRKMLMHRWIGGKHTAIDNYPERFSAACEKRYFTGY